MSKLDEVISLYRVTVTPLSCSNFTVRMTLRTVPVSRWVAWSKGLEPMAERSFLLQGQ